MKWTDVPYAIGCVLFLVFIVGAVTCFFTGLYLAFSASIILGIACLVVEPSPMILGLFYWGFGRDLAQELVLWLSR